MGDLLANSPRWESCRSPNRVEAWASALETQCGSPGRIQPPRPATVKSVNEVDRIEDDLSGAVQDSGSQQTKPGAFVNRTQTRHPKDVSKANNPAQNSIRNSRQSVMVRP